MVVRTFIVWCFCVLAGAVHAADFSVTFISPGGITGFWGEVAKTMAAAADDLNADLEILYADRQPYAMEELLSHRLEQGNLPDYFVLVNENQSAARLLQILAGKPSKVLLLLNKLTAKQKRTLELRNIDMHNVVASIIPDNETAGYEMAQSLFVKARQAQPEGGQI